MRCIIIAMGVFLALPGAGQAQGAAPVPSADEVVERLAGNYELILYETFPASGGAVDNRYIGRITYDVPGNMSAVLMPEDFSARASEGTGAGSAEGFAYFSTVEVQPELERVIHHVHGSVTTPQWVGTGLIRYYEFDDDLLMLSIRNAEGRTTGTLTWRRMD